MEGQGAMAPLAASRRLGLHWLLAAAAVSAEPRFARLIKGVSYGPVPLKSPKDASRLAQDDWMDISAKPMWGPKGRADLKLIKALGANFVRLYGNNPNNDHTFFLDEAYTNGLKVAPGLSDWPYYQNPNRTMPDTPCKYTGYNCYEQVLPLYRMNLQKGFLTPDKRYHPALGYMNIINEPDLKMPTTTNIQGREGPEKMARTIISAFDAMLTAEKEVGVQGTGINFTTTFSYAVCKPCIKFNRHPAIGQMATLDDAMLRPEKYGYKPHNDIAEAYRTRWTHSFNTQNKAHEIPDQFMKLYEESFPSTPVYIGEYHHPGINETEDLEQIMEIASESGVFLGVSFFQFQSAYWKGGTEQEFGMFELGVTSLAPMAYFGENYDIFCLKPKDSPKSGMTVPEALAKAYGGPYFDPKDLCQVNPDSVDINGEGFRKISKQGKASRMATFVTRTLQHLGGFPIDSEALLRFSEQFVGVQEDAFGTMVGFLVQRPGWTYFDPAARCVSDRNAEASVVGNAIGYVCSNATLQRIAGFNCSEPPEACGDVYSLGDWVFSNYYKTVKAPRPLENCNFAGAAMYASSAYYAEWSPACVFGGSEEVAQMVPAVPFTPFSPRYRAVQMGMDGGLVDEGSSLGAGPGDIGAGTGSPLGTAESAGVATSQAASGSSMSWLIPVIGVAVLAAVGFGLYSMCGSKKKKSKSGKERKKDRMRKRAAELEKESPAELESPLQSEEARPLQAPAAPVVPSPNIWAPTAVAPAGPAMPLRPAMPVQTARSIMMPNQAQPFNPYMPVRGMAQ